MMHRFTGVTGAIFDCDGTLLDTLGAWDDAERDLFAQTGPLTQEQEDEIHSAPIEQAAELFHEKYGVGKSADAVLEHLDSHLLDYYAHKAKVLPGVEELVTQFCKRGVPCVVVSSSPRRYLEAGLAHVGLLECFKELVTTDESGCSKREEKIYERALKILGSEPDTTWCFDDAPYAIEVMHSCGLKTICVGSRESSAADFNVASLTELLD